MRLRKTEFRLAGRSPGLVGASLLLLLVGLVSARSQPGDSARSRPEAATTNQCDINSPDCVPSENQIADAGRPATTPSPRGLITRTTDAIYRVLSDMFTRDDDNHDDNGDDRHAGLADDEFGQRRPALEGARPRAPPPLDATTPLPRVQTTTARAARKMTPTTTQRPSSRRPQTTTVRPGERPELAGGSRTSGPGPGPTGPPPPPPSSSHRLFEVSPTVEWRHYSDEPSTTGRPSKSAGAATPGPRRADQPGSEASPVTVRPAREQRAQVEREQESRGSPATNSTPDGAGVRRRELWALLFSAISSIEAAGAGGGATQVNRATRLIQREAAEGSPDEQLDWSRAPNGKLVLLDEQLNSSSARQFATRQDVHLLCKLLHNQLELSEANRTRAGPALADKSRASVAPAAESQADKLREPKFYTENELSERHEELLLESAFVIWTGAGADAARPSNRTQAVSPPSSSSPPPPPDYDELGVRLLSDLFNLAHSASRRPAENESDSSLEADARPGHELLRVKVWNKSVTGVGSRSGRLKLVYWLLEPAGNLASKSNESLPTHFRALNASEAGALLDRLDHSLVHNQLEAARLRPINLVRPYEPANRDEPVDKWAQPNVVDDTLSAQDAPGAPDAADSANRPKQAARPGAGPPATQPKPSGALQRWANQFASSPFGDQLYLYVLLLAAALFILVLCFAFPAMCRCDGCCGRRRRRSESRGLGQPGGRSRARPGQTTGAGGRRQQRRHLLSNLPEVERIASISSQVAKSAPNDSTSNLVARGADEQPQQQQLQQLRLQQEAIWKKLSNSTTTLVKDQARLVENTGAAAAGAADQWTQTQRPQFEWYSIEDHHEKVCKRQRAPTGDQLSEKSSQTLIFSDRRHLSKSIQTFDGGDADQEARDLFGGASRDDRLEARNSNTLTKSELVMLKEKLIPIGTQTSLDRRPPEAADLPPRPAPAPQGGQQQVAHDYVNQSQFEQSKPPAEPPGASAPAHTRRLPDRGDDERQPTLISRRLELPEKYGQKVEAIKAELDRLERRDRASAGHYRRFDEV